MSAEKKEKLLIENLLSSRDVFSRCSTILKAEYFDQPEYKAAAKFVLDYFNKYSNLPPIHVVNAEFDLTFQEHQITVDQHKYTCDEVERFCQESSVIHAIRDCFDLIEKNDRAGILKRVTDAVGISLQKDMGIDLYDNPEERLRALLSTQVNYSTGIQAFDSNLDGGLARQTLTLFSANSGVGKSNMLGNLGVNYSLQGFNVLYISLELPQDMMFLRLTAMGTDSDISAWKSRIVQIAGRLLVNKQSGAGSFTIKRLTQGTTAIDIRAYLRNYELEFGFRPDVICIDYLDLMHPNGGTKNKGVFEQDKEKAEELTEILVDYNAIGVSASQQNREALRMAAPDQGVIAGGISKVNTVHNYISLSMDDEMAQRGEMNAFFLKTRTSSGKGKMVQLKFDHKSLRITDSATSGKTAIKIIKTADNKKTNAPWQQKVQNIIGNIQSMKNPLPPPNIPEEKMQLVEMLDPDTGEIIFQELEMIQPPTVTTAPEPELALAAPPKSSELMDLMNSYLEFKK